jgi:hypothetical protein
VTTHTWASDERDQAEAEQRTFVAALVSALREDGTA